MLWAHVVMIATLGYCVVFALASCCYRPALARFLSRFAQDIRGHVLELVVRTLIGLAAWQLAEHARWPALLTGLAAVLLLTTLGLALMPWRWHQAIAMRTVPKVIPHLRWLGGVALLFAAGLSYALGYVGPDF